MTILLRTGSSSKSESETKVQTEREQLCSRGNVICFWKLCGGAFGQQCSETQIKEKKIEDIALQRSVVIAWLWREEVKLMWLAIFYLSVRAVFTEHHGWEGKSILALERPWVYKLQTNKQVSWRSYVFVFWFFLPFILERAKS